MEERDGKKPFTIPKTHTSTKEVFITEKPDSRNVTDLFVDIKSCALEAQFDFRQNDCKSCDTIRNQKLQKLYNNKRIKMKIDQDPTERLAFHLITYRDVAATVANDGLLCEQLSFPIERYLGNPKDGVHLSRRPDVVLTSSGAQGLYRFGLLVCKVLLGKGYATIPSTTNNQFSAQLHYDHHFCKIQAMNKEQRQTDDLLANSLVFCYEHENFETISHPTQILPIAILWYDLTEKFAPELISSTIIKNPTQQESQRQSGKPINRNALPKKKKFNFPTKDPSLSTQKLTRASSTSNSSLWKDSVQKPLTVEITQPSNSTESPTKYPSHFMIPYHRVYSNPVELPSTIGESEKSLSTTITHQITSSRDPRLLRAKRDTAVISSETIPLSPQQLLQERSLSNGSASQKSSKISSDEHLSLIKSSSQIHIPLIPLGSLTDPRLKTIKQTRNIFYLELQAVKRALQQQKRLNHHHDPKSGLPPKTSYSIVPFLARSVPLTDYERFFNDGHQTHKFSKHSNGTDYSLLYVSVVDCLNFGLLKPATNQSMYVDLEQSENRLAFEQMEISNELIEREKQLNSQQIRLRIREKRQRRMQQHIDEKKNFKSAACTSVSPSIPSSKLYIATGRQLLKEHQTSTGSSSTQFSPDLLDFFSREYKQENRPHVKHLLAELIGVFIEKYHLQNNQTVTTQNSVEEPTTDDQTINSVIDMDLDSPSSQGLCDYDERFRVPSPPPLPPPVQLPPLPPPTEAITSLNLTPTLSNEPNRIFDDDDYKERCQKLVEQLQQEYQHKEKPSLTAVTKSEAIIPTEEDTLKACLGQLGFSSSSASSDNSPSDDNRPLLVSEDLHQHQTLVLQDDSNRSRDEFVKLLTQEAYVSKSSSPMKVSNTQRHSCDSRSYRRRSQEKDDYQKKKASISNHFDSSRSCIHSSNKKTRRVITASNKKVSSNRATILNADETNLQMTVISTENANVSEDDESPTMTKRLKMDTLSPAMNSTVEIDDNSKANTKDTGLRSIVGLSAVADNQDYRCDLNEKRRTVTISKSSVLVAADKKDSSQSRSHSKSNEQHRQRQPSSTNFRHSSRSNSTVQSDLNQKLKKYSTTDRSSNGDRHRPQPKTKRNEHQHERRRTTPDSSKLHQKSYSNQLPDRYDHFYETSYRNSLSSAYSQRNMTELILPSSSQQQQQQPVRHKRFNYNHQSVADHPRFTNPCTLPSPSSPTHHSSASPTALDDRNGNAGYYQDKYMEYSDSTTTTTNHSKSFDAKQSLTIERLRMILKNEASNPFEEP